MMDSASPKVIRQSQMLLPDGNFLLGDLLIAEGIIQDIAPEIIAPLNSSIIRRIGINFVTRGNRSSSPFSGAGIGA
jgi:dihydroorotase